MPYPYYQPFQAMYQPNIQQTQQVQNNGIITVRNKQEAFNYPIAPGNSLTFKNETEPYIYTKTLGFSQLDRPVFEVFRLERENVTTEVIPEQPAVEQSFLTIENAALMQNEINTLKEEIKFLKDYIDDDRKEAKEDV